MLAEVTLAPPVPVMAKKGTTPRIGRPPKEESQRFTKSPTVWLTAKQLDFVDTAVERSGVSRVVFLRQAVLERAAVVLGRKAPGPIGDE